MGQTVKDQSEMEECFGSSRGQAEMISVVLLMGITVAGMITVVALGSVAIEENKQVSEIQGTDHAMTQLDSRAAVVALGESDSQEVDLGRSIDGSYAIDEDAGQITITHTNQSQTSPPDEEIIFNDSLGMIVYQNGDTDIAYQGGGVWRKRNNGSTMVSPPEFHYQSATLTFPIIRVTGTGSASGRVIAEITMPTKMDRIYPDPSTTYTASGDPYQNPVSDGNISVTVQSEYYQAWESYFRSRTEGEVTVFHSNQTVSVTLLSSGEVGEFDMPADGNSIEIRGLSSNDHSVENFTVTLHPDDTDAADFSNLQWSLYDDQGSQQIEIHLRDSGKNDNSTTDCEERDVAATVYYSGQNGDPYHGWHNDTAFRTECYDGDGDGNDDETRLSVDFNGDTNLSMESLSSSNLIHFSPGGDTFKDPVEFNEHDGSVGWEPETFNSGDQTAIGDLIGHYFALMAPNVELTVEDKSSDTVNEDASGGTLEYDSSGQFVTFLHVTENEIKVKFE